MLKIKPVLGILILAAFVLAACGSPQAVDEVMSENSGNGGNTANAMDTGDEMKDNMANSSEDSMADEEMAEDSHNAMADNVEEDMEDNSGEMAEESNETEKMESSVTTPPWFDYEFTEATTGETFTINDFRGKVVLVEMMATWCSNCMKQQIEVRKLREMLGDRDDFVVIAISVESELDLLLLSGYAKEYDFDWLYSVANRDVQRDIQASMGGQFLNPPATPIFIMDKDGNTHTLSLGRVKPAADLLESVESFLN